MPCSALRRKHIRVRTWRLGHTALVTVTVIGSVVHAVLIEGTMEVMSKVGLCALVLIATVKVLTDLRVWSVLTRPKA